MQKARCHAGPRGRRSNRLKARGFRVCFTPLLEVLFTFPSRYSCAIGLSVVFSLAGWSPPIPAEFLVLRGTQGSAWPGGAVSRTGLSPAMAARSCAFRCRTPRRRWRPYNPGRASTRPVWAPARSLAATGAIILIFSSCGYWDVSVPRVRPAPVEARRRDCSRRVSPFGHPRVAGHLPLAAAFRSLSRPSSPPRAAGIPRAPLIAFLLSGGRPRPCGAAAACLV